MLPQGEPSVAHLVPMKNQDDAIKELLSLFELWESLALKDPLRL
jgi:hypothetical protein